MEPYGNDMFLSQEGYASIDFTLLDRPSTSVAPAPESTAALLPDSSFPSFDFLDSSGVDSFGGVLHTTGDAHFGGQPRLEMGKDIGWRKEKALHCSSTDMYIQGGGNQQAKLSSPQFHIPVSQVDFFSPKQSSVDNLQGQLSTSGNRVPDEVHDFFEQEHLSQQQTQSDRTENWSVLNKNSWPADSQNEESRFVHHTTNNTDLSRNNELVSTAMLSFMSKDTQPDDGRHVSQMALGLRSQGGPSNNVMGQPRNQSLNFDNLLNGSSTGHIRANQATSSGDGGTLERSHSNAGSLAGTNTQLGQNVSQRLNYDGSNSEMGESMEARVNYDFFGSQIHLKSQPEAGVQYHGARLQPGLDEMQVSKQQYTYQQIQELHRQQQAQQQAQQAQQQAQQAQQQVQQSQQQAQQSQQQAQQLEHQARQLQLQQYAQWQLQLQQQARQLHLQQQERQHNAQRFERQPHVQQQQQSQQVMLHTPQQPAHQLEQQARQYQAQQIEQQARQHQAQQLEQQARQQQSQRFDQQVRQHQAQQLEQQARDQQVWQQRAQQLEQQAPHQQAQQLERQSHQQQFHLLDPHAGQLQAQQHLEQLAQRQKQLRQLLAGGNQNLGNQLPSALFGSALHDESNIMRSTGLMSQVAVESHTPTLLPGNVPHLNIGNANFMPNGLSSLPGFSPDLLRDPILARKVLAYMGARLNPSGYGVASNMRDGIGQPLNSHPSSQGAIQQLADVPPHKLVTPSNIQAGKEVTHIISSGDPTPSTNDVKQGALKKSVFEHSFTQNQGVSNLQQGTTMSSTSQLQNLHSKQQHRSWDDDLGQKENFQNDSSQDAPSESGFHNFQQGGWHNLPPTLAIGSSDGKNQIMSTGQYVLQGEYQAGNTDFFNTSAVKPQGSWSALMQSAVAESPSADGEPDDWGGLNLQRNETISDDALQFHPNEKEPNVWSEQTAQMHDSLDGRPLHLFNDESFQSVQGLQQDISEGRDHIGSKLEGIQHINQSKLQLASSSKFLPEGTGQANKWQDHNPYQHIVKNSSQSYSNFESRQTNSWKDHNTAQVPSEAVLPPQHINFDGRHQNNSLQKQGSFETERHKVLNLTSNNQRGWNKSEAQETEENNLSLNCNKVYRENENENVMHLQKEQLGGHVGKGGDQTYQARYEGNKSAGVPFQRQDPRVNLYENGKPLQQGDFNMGTFPKIFSNNNMENSSERLQHTPGMKYPLDGCSNVILDTSVKHKAMGNASIYHEGNSAQAWNSFPNSFSSPQGEPNGRTQTQFSQNDSAMAGQMMGKNDHTLQCAKVGNDGTRNSPQREDNLQSVSSVNHRGYSRLGKINIGSVENFGNDKLRMMPGHMSQQMVGNASTNYRSAEDPSLRGGTLHMDLLGQKASEQTDFGLLSAARTVSINSTMHTGEDLLDTNLQTDLRETGGGHLKDISSGHTSSNSPAFDRSTNIGNANKLGSLSSQNVLDLLTKPDRFKGSDTSKGNVVGEQNVSTEMRESSDASHAHFGHTQSNFGLRLASPSQQQLLQMLHGRSLLSNPMQTSRLLSDRQIHPLREDAGQKNTALLAHQGSSSSDGQRLHLTASGKSVNIPHELSATVPKDNAVDLKEKLSSVAAYDSHPPKSQMHHIQHTNVGGQLASSPQSMFLHTVPEPQSNVQASMMRANQIQGSQDEVIAGQCNTVNQSMALSVNSLTERESDMQGSMPSSAILFGHGGYSSDLHAQDGQSHKVMSLNSSMSGPRNANQFLHDSASQSTSHLPGTSGRAQSAAFSKLYNALKMNCTNQQRMPIGIEKAFPTVFESFRQPVGGAGLPFVPRPDNHIKFGVAGKSIVSVPNQPNIINYQQPASAEEFSNQENSFQVHRMPSDRGESRESPALHNPGMSLPGEAPILPQQTSVQSSQLSKVHSQGQDQRRLLVSKNNLSKPSSIISSLHSGHRTHNEDEIKYTFGHDSKAIAHPTCQATQQQSDSCSDGPVDSQVSELSDAPHYQYVDNRKRMKITDAGSSGIGRSLSIKSSDQIMNPHTGMEQFKVSSTSMQHEHGAISADARMIPSSQEFKERIESAASQDMASLMRPLQNAGFNPIMYQLAQSSLGADDRSHVNPQFANARLLQFGAYPHEKLFASSVAAMYKRMGESAALMSKQMTPGRNVDCLVPGSELATPVASHTSKTSLKEVESMAQPQNSGALSLPSTKRNVMDQYQYYLSKSNVGPPVTVLPKKRKKFASPLIPWHIEISQVGGELLSTRNAELAWAIATNRLTEKEDGIDGREEGTKSVARIKRRLKLTTQLMQQLIPPLPSAVVRGKAIIEYENATYTLAKTALADACKLVSTSRTDRENDVENENMAFGQIKKSKRLKAKSLQRIAEEFVDRAKNFDDEFSRFEGMLSINELRSETQDLDSLAITNRLVKHHGMSLPVDNTKNVIEDSLSDSYFCTRKQHLQRYVTAVPMPRNLPEGMLCISL